jgi:hypothetical protein
MDCIRRTNKLTFICSHFIRSYVLYCFKKDLDIPKLDDKFIRIAYKLFSSSSCGPKGKRNIQLEKFYKLFCKLTEYEQISSRNLSYILKREYEILETMYINNIKMNFQKYLNKYVNVSFNVPVIKRLSKEEFKKLDKFQKNAYNIKRCEQFKRKKEILSKIKSIKDDLINDTNNSPSEYTDWITEFRENVIPIINTGTLMDDISKNPLNYVKPMIIMNRRLEDNGIKLFQFLSLRNDICDKYVQIDSSALKDIFTEVHTNITKDDIWKKYFNLDKFKIKGYVFNNLISTDGTSVSISFMKADSFNEKEKLSKKRTESSKKGKEKLKELSESDKNKYLDKLQQNNKIKNDNFNEKKKKYSKQKKDIFKLLPKEEQNKIRIQIMIKKNEFNYIEDIIKDKDMLKYLKHKYKNNNIVVVDPGSRSPMTMINRKHIRFEYRKRRRLKELKRTKYTRLRQNKLTKLLNETNTEELMEKLSGLNKKTTFYGKFMEYIKTKLSFLKKIANKRKEYSDYNNKLKWYSYINKERHEDKLLNELEEKYGKDAIYVIGDWSKRNSCIKGISTPNIGMKRLLKKRFEVYLIDEFNTSKINHETHKEQEHLKISVDVKQDGKIIKKVREIYSVLTYQMRNKRIGCINRDFNAVLNMMHIVKSYVNGEKRPEYLQRQPKDLTKIKKSTNLFH